MNLQIELDDEQAWALAQLLKRIGWNEACPGSGQSRGV